jgi:hypothetical protein
MSMPLWSTATSSTLKALQTVRSFSGSHDLEARFANGGTQSPMTELMHEIAHDVYPAFLRNRLLDGPMPGYDNLEEYRVIHDVETPGAKFFNEGIRFDHHSGVPYSVMSPIDLHKIGSNIYSLKMVYIY